jgi:hypothetical protein
MLVGMARELPEFLTLRQAAVLAMRGHRTMLKWVNAGFLKIVEGGYHPTQKGHRPRHIVLRADLDQAIRRAERLEPIPPGERRGRGSQKGLFKAWWTKLTEAQREKRRRRHQEYKRAWQKQNAKLKKALRLSAPSPGPKRAGRCSPAGGTSGPSSANGKSRPRATRSPSATGGASGPRPSPRRSPASSGASPLT